MIIVILTIYVPGTFFKVRPVSRRVNSWASAVQVRLAARTCPSFGTDSVRPREYQEMCPSHEGLGCTVRTSGSKHGLHPRMTWIKSWWIVERHYILDTFLFFLWCLLRLNMSTLTHRVCIEIKCLWGVTYSISISVWGSDLGIKLVGGFKHVLFSALL